MQYPHFSPNPPVSQAPPPGRIENPVKSSMMNDLRGVNGSVKSSPVKLGERLDERFRLAKRAGRTVFAGRMTFF